IPRQGKQSHTGQRRLCPNTSSKSKSVHTGHADVRNQTVRRPVESGVERRRSVVGNPDIVPPEFKHDGERLDCVGVVIDQQHTQRPLPSGYLSRPPRAAPPLHHSDEMQQPDSRPPPLRPPGFAPLSYINPQNTSPRSGPRPPLFRRDNLNWLWFPARSVQRAV